MFEFKNKLTCNAATLSLALSYIIFVGLQNLIEYSIIGILLPVST